MSTKQKVQKVVFRDAVDDDEGPPQDLVGFIKWFQDKLDGIPEEHRAETKAVLGVQSAFYGEYVPHIEITYLLDETDEQFNSRLKREEHQKQVRVHQEMRTLAALLAKYGKPT